MRLVLLCLYDKRSMEEIKDVLPWAKETDVRLTSHRIKGALMTLHMAMDEPTVFMNPGHILYDEPSGDLTDPQTPFPVPTHTIPNDIETQLRQALFPSTQLILFGAHVPTSVYRLGLLARVAVYLIVVEEMTWDETMALLDVSERTIRTSLAGMVEATA